MYQKTILILNSMKWVITILSIALSLQSCKNDIEGPGWIDEKRLINREPEDWLSLGGNYRQQHYSPLNQINAENVFKLGFAWEYDARSTIGRVSRGLEASPFVVDGIMYTSGAWGFVYALDAKSGEEVWRFDPKVDASYARRACCDVVNRGVAVWKGKVYVGSLDGFLICLDASNGKELWRVDTFYDRTKAYTITGPPQVAGNIVMIGNSGGEYGVRGYVTAYDLISGKEKWRFFTVPGDPENGYEHKEMEMAASTWDPNSYWEAGGGGTSWGQSAYDPEINLLYVGTGNASPYPIWFRSPSGGDNLFLASILAINPDTGELAWHYQTTPSEMWDFTATMNIILAEMEIDGQLRKVLMQAPKNGFFYVLDRITGELISAEKFSRVNWASHINMKTGKPVLTGQGWYKEGPKLVLPAEAGAHNWEPMSYNPLTKLVYIPEITMPMTYASKDTYTWQVNLPNTGVSHSVPFNVVSDQVEQVRDTIVSFSLKAWDPIAQKQVWQVKDSLPDGGTLSTPDLVFQGSSTGYLRAYHAKTGHLLKELFVGTGIRAAPVSYSIDGEQFIAVMAGYGGAPTFGYDKSAVMHRFQNYGRILAFKLGGKETPIPPKVIEIKVPEPPQIDIDKATVEKGKTLFAKYCMICHGLFGDQHRSLHPDLSKMAIATHKIFDDIVLKGAFSSLGMTSFQDTLDEEDVEAIHQFLLYKQKELYEIQQDQSD